MSRTRSAGNAVTAGAVSGFTAVAAKGTLGLLKVALLAIAVFNLVFLILSAPVANTDARVEGPFGDWRVQSAAAMFENSRYLREISMEFLLAAAREGDEALLEGSREAARNSLNHAPADPFGWLLLGWSEALLLNDADAEFALQRSWRLAPNSPVLARDRLFLAEALGVARTTPLEPTSAAAIDRDLNILKLRDKRIYDFVLERAAGLRGYVIVQNLSERDGI
ncbi:MAG: hypothetical protein AAGD34_14225 [Pseudomonadota bacterium]